MELEVNSGQIIADCRQRHGQGELFFRTDGLAFETRRAEARRQYLEAHDVTNAEHREAILKAAITPGMTRAHVIAAWGLFEEDTRLVFGHVTDAGSHTYAYFTGFEVGTRYALYFQDDILSGVRQTDELVPPHERELDMRIDEGSHQLFYYDGTDGELRSSTADQFNMDWDTAHHHLYTVEVVPRASRYRIEVHLEAAGALAAYEAALKDLGYDSSTAPDELRTRIALSLLPYPPLPRPETHEEMAHPTESDDWRLLPGAEVPVADAGSQTAVAPSSLDYSPPSDASFSKDADLPRMPPADWFTYIERRQQEAAFPTADGNVELLKVEWQEELVFRVLQVPLLVNGVSFYDWVEVEWQDGDIIPRFKKVVDNGGERTIRAAMGGLRRPEHLAEFLNTHMERRHPNYRFERKVLAFTISGPELEENTKQWLEYLDVSWIYTDTLDQG